LSAVPKLVHRGAPHSMAHPAMRAKDTKNKQWCAGEGVGQRRWWVRAWWSGSCAQMQARRRHAMCHACISEGVRAPFPPPLPPPRHAPDLFNEPTPGARTPALLPLPLPFILCLSLCPPLCLTLAHLVLTGCRQGTPNKASGFQQDTSTNTRHQLQCMHTHTHTSVCMCSEIQ